MGLRCHNRLRSLFLILCVTSTSILCTKANNTGKRKRSRRKDHDVTNTHLYEVYQPYNLYDSSYNYSRGRDRGKSAPSSSHISLNNRTPGPFEGDLDSELFVEIPSYETKTTQISDHALVKDYSNMFFSEHQFSAPGISSNANRKATYTANWKYYGAIMFCLVVLLSL